MTLEAAIQENTSAIRELIAAISKGVPTTTAQVAAVVAEAPKTDKSAKAVTEPEAPAKPETAAPATSQAASDSAPAASAPTYEEVKHAIVKLSGSKGRDAVVSLLSEFGAGKGPDLKPEQFADFIAKATQLVAA